MSIPSIALAQFHSPACESPNNSAMWFDAASSRLSGEASTLEPLEESSVNLKGGQTLFVWGSKSTLQPQGTLEWPLWLHPRTPGLFTFHCVWYYEPSTPVDGMKFRSALPSTVMAVNWLLLYGNIAACISRFDESSTLTTSVCLHLHRGLAYFIHVSSFVLLCMPPKSLLLL